MKPQRILLYSATAAPLGLWCVNCLAAACCGGSTSAPSLLLGDDQAQLSATYSYSQVVVDNVGADGIWHIADEHENMQSLRLDGAFLLSDRWQFGASVPIVQHSLTDESYSGLGDLETLVGYEYLPDWDYNPYRPKGIGFLEINWPTGQSPYETDLGPIGSTGTGFFSVGLGTFLLKSYRRWDGFTLLEVHRSFPHSVDNSFANGQLVPGYGGNWQWGLGYNLRSWRLGAMAGWTYEDPISLQGSVQQVGSPERYATASATVSYMAGSNWVASLSYVDQTLLGSPVNASLSRGVALQVLRRWAR